MEGHASGQPRTADAPRSISPPAILSHGTGDSGAARLASVIDRARAEGIRTVFVQPQFSMEAARMVAGEIGAVIRSLDPLRRDPLEALRETTDAVLEAMAP